MFQSLSFKNTLRFSAFLLLATIFFGTVSNTDAQTRRRRRPVIRRTTAVAKPRVALYSVAANTKVRVRMQDTIDSKTAKVGDTFETRTLEPVYSTNGSVVIPEGSTVVGRVDAVTAARKGGKPGTIDVSFVQVKLPNGVTRSINGSLSDLESDKAKSNNEGTASGDRMSHRKPIFIGGGAAGGAVIGAIAGGGKGALIGAIIGGVGGAITENQTKGENAEVKSGTEFGVVLNQAISMPKYTEQ